LVMKDGIIAHEEVIDLPRQRDVADPAFAKIRGNLLDWLGVRHGTHGNV
jgi:sulfonate transport system ATP-binding protein